MGQIVPDAVEGYLALLNTARDGVLDRVADEGRALDLPIIDAEVGVLLQLLATAIGARRILEIGTATGYSAIWMGRALPADGLLLTIERKADRAERARRNFERAGLHDRVDVMVGDAARLVYKVSGPFDLIFNDGDKDQYDPLLDRLVDLLRPGGLLVTDNVLWSGEVVPGFVARPSRPTETTAAIAAFNARLVADPRLLTAIVPLRDGLAISVKCVVDSR